METLCRMQMNGFLTVVGNETAKTSIHMTHGLKFINGVKIS